MDIITQVIGATMSVISFVLWLPQARLVWTNRHDAAALSGVSVGTQVLVLVNAIGWAVYGLLTGAIWVGAPGIVNAPLSIATIYLVLRSRRHAVRSGEVASAVEAPVP